MNIIENQIKTFFNHIYLLQQENYDLRRFLAAVAPILFEEPFERDDRTVWTDKLLIIVAIAIVLHFSAAYMVAWILAFFLPFEWFLEPLLVVVMFIVLMSVAHIFLALATALMWPVDFAVKYYFIKKARQKIEAHPSLTVIGVAGSFGKTTMKEVIAESISGSKKVLKTKENFNTPVAIARMILEELTSDTDVLVVEMGEYEKGDIEKLASLTPPDIAVITGINETHLERMKTKSIIINTIFEIVEHAKPDAHIILNADDEEVMENYERFVGARATHLFSLEEENEQADFALTSIGSREDEPGVRFTLSRDGEELPIETRILGSYIAGASQAALIIGDILSLSREKVVEQITAMERLHRRLEIIPGREGVTVVDDTYNANADSMIAGLSAVHHAFEDKSTTVVLGDMFELGSASEDHHRKVGAYVAEEMSPSEMLLVGHQVETLADEAKKHGYPLKKIRRFKTVRDLIRSDVDWWSKEVIYVKGSNGMKLDKLVAALRERRGLEE